MSGSYKQKIKDIFQKFNVNPKSLGIKLEDEIKLEAEAKLMDGSMIYSSASEWAVGVDIYTKDEEGNPIPVPAGEYQLEDGTMVIVGDDGLVVEMKKMEEEEEMSTEDIFALVSSLTERVSALESDKQSLMEELAAEKDRRSKTANEVNSLKTELSSLKKSPATNSIKEKKSIALSQSNAAAPSKSFEQMTLKERILSNLENKK